MARDRGSPTILFGILFSKKLTKYEVGRVRVWGELVGVGFVTGIVLYFFDWNL